MSTALLVLVPACPVVCPWSWPEAVAAVPAAALVIATGAVPLDGARAEAERLGPSPVPYLQAAARLGAKPEDCLVIEDAPSGVESGLRAGMTVWGVNTPAAVDGVHRHFGSLREAVRDVLAFVSGPRPHGLEGPAAME